MTMVGDALTALKNVVLLQERLDQTQKRMDRLTSDLQGLNDYALSIDKRVIRIETMIEMSGRSPTPPRIEG